MITNTVNNKLYVGMTTYKHLSERMRRHKTSARSGVDTLFYRAMRKHGVDNFKIHLLEVCDDAVLSEREVYWIKELNSKSPNGYNTTIGGEKLFGKNNPFYGKTHSLESKKKISDRGKLLVGDKNPFYGKTHSTETKNKIREANTKYQKITCFQNKVKVAEFNKLAEVYDWLIDLNVTKSKNYSTLTNAIIKANKRGMKAYGYNWKIKSVETIETVPSEKSTGENGVE